MCCFYFPIFSLYIIVFIVKNSERTGGVNQHFNTNYTYLVGLQVVIKNKINTKSTFINTKQHYGGN